MTAFPTTPIPTTNLDTGTKSPAAARADLLTAVNTLNQIMTSLGQPSGIASIDANGNVVFGASLNLGINATTGFPRLTLSANAYWEFNSTTNSIDYYLGGVLKGSMPFANPATNNYNDLLNKPAIPISTTMSVLSYAATVNLPFVAGATSYYGLSLTGNVTLTTGNRGSNRYIAVRLDTQGTGDKTITFPAGWNWMTTIPSTVPNGKWAFLSLTCWGAAETDIFAAFIVQP